MVRAGGIAIIVDLLTPPRPFSRPSLLREGKVSAIGRAPRGCLSRPFFAWSFRLAAQIPEAGTLDGPPAPPTADPFRNVPPAPGRTGRANLPARAFAPVDIASLVFFRIALGLILLWEVLRYFANGWIASRVHCPGVPLFVFRFRLGSPVAGRWHVPPFSGVGVLAVFASSSACVTGPQFLLLGLGWTYVLLLDKAMYLNHSVPGLPDLFSDDLRPRTPGLLRGWPAKPPPADRQRPGLDALADSRPDRHPVFLRRIGQVQRRLAPRAAVGTLDVPHGRPSKTSFRSSATRGRPSPLVMAG